MKAKDPNTTVNFVDSDSDSDESSDEEQESIISTSEFALKESITKDLRLYGETRYEKLYT